MASASVTFARRAGVISRSFSSAAASPAHLDWTGIRSKMLTEETRAAADRAKDAYSKRLSSAESVAAAAPIDWAAYASKLPGLKVDALKDAYAKAVAALPVTSYDDAADKKAHEAKEAAWTGFAGYCTTRLAELESLRKEQAAHKLHRFYRRRQLYSRFPGLYESMHHKVRGQWDQEVWGNYLNYKAKMQALPWDPAHGDMTEEKLKDMKTAIATKAGVTPAQLGW